MARLNNVNNNNSDGIDTNMNSPTSPPKSNNGQSSTPATNPYLQKSLMKRDESGPPSIPLLSSSSSSPQRSNNKRPALPGYATYLPDWHKTEVLQRMVAVHPKFMSSYTGARYDSVEVMGAWQIINRAQQEKFEAAKASIRGDNPTSYGIPASYRGPMNELANTPLDAKAGEVFLLHGTNPDNLHSILFEGHQTELADPRGLFGKGIYFAENTAKIDQYSTNDARYEKGEGDVARLHAAIYRGCKHPKNVRYALVCRVLLGTHVSSSDGETRISDGGRVFTSDRRDALAAMQDGKTPDSLIGIPGKRARKFREFQPGDCRIFGSLQTSSYALQLWA